MKIDLTAREAPNPDEQLGVFADVVQATKTDRRGRNFSYLVVVGELAATKSDGKRFVASCSFNLDDERGLKSLRKQLQVWRDIKDIPDLGSFDPEKEFVGKTFLAKPAIAGKGKKREIQFSRFKRYTGDNPLTISADFVRANAAPQQP